jgi:hypothetical protein
MQINNVLIKSLIIFVILILTVGCQRDSQLNKIKGGDTMKLESPAFQNGAMIPERYTCQGQDINPELRWSDVPDGTKSLALIVEDPDAPMGIWIHWVLKNIDAGKRGIGENSKAGEQIRNSFGKEDYGGPCPPSGTHRYYFRLYALDTEELQANNIDDLRKEIHDHKIEEASLMGRYAKR